MSSPPDSSTALPHRRQRSGAQQNIPNGINTSRRSSYHRRNSSTQGHSPITPRSISHFAAPDSPTQQFHDGAMDAMPSGGGLGSLADELGEWDEDEEDMAIDDNVQSLGQELDNMDGPTTGDAASINSNGHGLSPSPARTNGRHRRNESIYDGSDYGEESDLEASEGISKGLERQMADVESLARRGLEENGSPSDGVIKRVTESLRDLGSQSAVETHATRLATASSAVSTHLTHQTRPLTSLTSTLFSPLAPPVPVDILESLLPLLDNTLPLIPHAAPEPLTALNALSHSTSDLLSTFSQISDSLHMSRQTDARAQRLLRAVKEAVGEWKRENEDMEQGKRYIDREDWDRRLREREGKTICDQVVSGFEERCGEVRKALVAGLSAA